MQSPVNDSPINVAEMTLEELVATFGAELGALVRRTSARLLLEAQQQAAEAIDQLHPDRWGVFPEGVESTPQDDTPQDAPLQVWVCDDSDLLRALRDAVAAGGRASMSWMLRPDLVEAITTAVYQVVRPRMAELEARTPEAQRSATDKRNEYLLVELGRMARRWVGLTAQHDGHTVYARERADAGRDVLAVLDGQGADGSTPDIASVAEDIAKVTGVDPRAARYALRQMVAKRTPGANASAQAAELEGRLATELEGCVSALQDQQQLAREVARLRDLDMGPVWLVPMLRADAKHVAGDHGRGRTPWPNTFPGRLMDSMRAVLGWPGPWDGAPAEPPALELEGNGP